MGGLSRSVHAATSKLYTLLWCAFAIEDRPKGLCECPPAGLALVTLGTFASLTVLFYVPLVLTLDLPEIKVIRVGTKFAYPSYLSPGLTCFLSVLRI